MSMWKKIVMLSLASTLAACGDDTTTPPAGYTPTGKGPAAKTYCKSSNKNAFDTFGAPAFVAVNKAIIKKTLDELGGPKGTTNLGTSFTMIGTGTDSNKPAYKDDAATFEGKLAAFLVYVYGGPESITYADGKMYNGVQDMTAAHIGMNITSAQYDYFITNMVVPALTENGVTADDVSSCFAPAVTDAGFKASIVGK